MDAADDLTTVLPLESQDPDPAAAEADRFDYNSWLERLGSTSSGALGSQGVYIYAPPAPAAQRATEAHARPATATAQSLPPAPAPAAVAMDDATDVNRELSEAELELAQTDLEAERAARRAQALEISSLTRQLEFASAELSRVRSAHAKLQDEIGSARATEEAQRAELREGSARGSRDGAVIRSLQQREATLLSQLTGALHERDAATSAAQSHQSEAALTQAAYSQLQTAQAEERASKRPRPHPRSRPCSRIHAHPHRVTLTLALSRSAARCSGSCARMPTFVTSSRSATR